MSSASSRSGSQASPEVRKAGQPDNRRFAKGEGVVFKGNKGKNLIVHSIHSVRSIPFTPFIPFMPFIPFHSFIHSEFEQTPATPVPLFDSSQQAPNKTAHGNLTQLAGHPNPGLTPNNSPSPHVSALWLGKFMCLGYPVGNARVLLNGLHNHTKILYGYLVGSLDGFFGGSRGFSS